MRTHLPQRGRRRVGDHRAAAGAAVQAKAEAERLRMHDVRTNLTNGRTQLVLRNAILAFLSEAQVKMTPLTFDPDFSWETNACYTMIEQLSVL